MEDTFNTQSSLQVTNIRLRSAVFKINDKTGEGEFDINPKIKTLVSKNANERHANVRLFVSAFSGDNIPFVLDVEYEAFFVWEKELDDTVDDMLSINGSAMLYSYMRPIFSNMSSAAGMPPLILPMMDFTKRADRTVVDNFEKAHNILVAKE